MRSSQFDKLNLINLAEKIEDSGKSEKRELANRLTLLITYLLKQQFSLQTKAWVEIAIKNQRKAIKRATNTQSFKSCSNIESA